MAVREAEKWDGNKQEYTVKRGCFSCFSLFLREDILVHVYMMKGMSLKLIQREIGNSLQGIMQGHNIRFVLYKYHFDGNMENGQERGQNQKQSR